MFHLGHTSVGIHSRYIRHVADLPSAGRKVRLRGGAPFCPLMSNRPRAGC